jgi:hypothetical protein
VFALLSHDGARSTRDLPFDRTSVGGASEKCVVPHRACAVLNRAVMIKTINVATCARLSPVIQCLAMIIRKTAALVTILINIIEALTSDERATY